MPLIVFQCECGKEFEKILPFREVNDDTTALCAACGNVAPRVLFSPTLRPHFYGEGWEKPSPTKRYSTKLVSSKTGNDASIG